MRPGAPAGPGGPVDPRARPGPPGPNGRPPAPPRRPPADGPRPGPPRPDGPGRRPPAPPPPSPRPAPPRPAPEPSKPEPESPEPPPARERRIQWLELPTTDQHTIRGLVCGAVAFALVLAVRLAGLADGPVGLALAGVLLLLVPSSRELSRRVLHTGAIVAGWLPVLWWIDLPVGAVGRATLLLALLAGGLAAWVACGPQPLARARALVPRIRAADVALPVVAAGAVLLHQPFLSTKTPVQSLALLMTGWDNSAHYSMYSMLRTYGVTVDGLTAPPPSGGVWQFTSYPEGFHALVATVAELLVGPTRRDVGTELLLYGRGTALVVLGAVLVVVAGLCALPAARRRPALAVPGAVLVATAFLVGPGAEAVNGGFSNFLLACALTVVVALVVLPMPRVFLPVPLGAAAGALLGVASGWVLLLAVAAPAALALLVPMRRPRWRGDRVQVIASLTVVVVMLECMGRTAAVLMRVTATDPLLIVGGIVAPNLGLVAAATVGALGACVWAARRGPRLLALAVAPFVGGGVAVALAVAQLNASGVVTYYGYKFMTGLLLAALGIAAAALLHALSPPPWDGLAARVRAAAGGLALAVAATQVFGLTWVLPTLPGELRIGAPGVVDQRAQQAMIDAPPSMTELAVRAADVQAEAGTRLVFYLDAPADGHIDPLLAAQWYFALTDTWTMQGNALATRYRLSDGSPDDVAKTVRGLFTGRPDVLVATPAVTAVQLRFLLEPELANRVIELG
ncbi:hypothetical protein ACQEVB_08010 [Pseudonocardia sp. CA-107938]|uniref:hypothetical protein n=1 Tax=Pseudonocardia sp. CA-107938 TaxID=3240021 RepID=UPI003D916393